jgi:C4-dicarboxylate transporter, DctM subunit
MVVKKALRVSGTAALSLLALLPLAVRAFSGITRIAVPSADLAQVNLVFVFAGLAGTLAAEEGRHLSLGAFDARKFDALRRVTGPALSFLTAFVLTALFATSLSEVGMAFKPDELVWGIPLRLVFAALPAAFLSMAAIALAKSEHRVSAAGSRRSRRKSSTRGARSPTPRCSRWFSSSSRAPRSGYRCTWPSRESRTSRSARAAVTSR